MAREKLTVLDGLDASTYNMLAINEYVLFRVAETSSRTNVCIRFGDMLDSDFDNLLGAQFESTDAGFGGFGPYPDLESEAREISEASPYFLRGELQDAFTTAEGAYQNTMVSHAVADARVGHPQLVIPGSGRPDLVTDIAADMPVLSSTTPSVSDMSGYAPTPPASPSGVPLVPSKKSYERASDVKRRHQKCYCVFPECNNKEFTRQEGLDRHYGSRHNLAKERFECEYCRKTDVRMDKAKNHWRNKHEPEGLPFQPRKIEKPIHAQAALMYAAAMEGKAAA